MKNIVKYVFISVLISSITYSYFQETDYQLFRIISAVSLFSFYVIAIIVFLKYVNIKSKKQNELFVWYTVFICSILFSSLRLKEEDIRVLFLHPYSFSAFFICVIVFFVKNNSKETIYLFSRYITFLLPFVTLLEVIIFNSPLSLVICYTSFFYTYLFASKKLRLWIIVNLVASAYVMLIYDYRAGFLIICSFFFFLGFKRIFYFLDKRVFRTLFLLGSAGVALLIFFNFTTTYNFVLSIVGKVGLSTVDTRSFLFLEFFEALKGWELLLGRGYLGTYYSIYFRDWTGEGGDHFIRSVAEVGFLQTILKGGIFLTVAFLIICIRSIYKGFVLSKPNSWQFLASGWLLIELMMFTLENIPSFNLHFLYVWLLIGLLSKEQSSIRQIR